MCLVKAFLLTEVKLSSAVQLGTEFQVQLELRCFIAELEYFCALCSDAVLAQSRRLGQPVCGCNLLVCWLEVIKDEYSNSPYLLILKMTN